MFHLAGSSTMGKKRLFEPRIRDLKEVGVGKYISDEL